MSIDPLLTRCVQTIMPQEGLREFIAKKKIVQVLVMLLGAVLFREKGPMLLTEPTSRTPATK